MRCGFRFPATAAFLLTATAVCAVAQSPPPRDSLLVTPGWLALRLADPELVVLQIDRESTGYQAGHIPGARFVPLDAIVVTRDSVPNELPRPAELDSVLEAAGVSTGSRIVIYGEPLAAARMFFTLDYLGVGDRTALLDGGLPRWKAEGFPLSMEPWQGEPGRLEWTLHPQVVVDAAWVHHHLADPTAAILDARPEADFVPHLPGAGSLPWPMLRTAPEPARLKEPAILARLFHRAGADPGETPVVYCRTGMQAAYLYFVARYLGYAPRLYDGSFADWSRRPGLPVAR